jgi:hypothetical protein
MEMRNHYRLVLIVIGIMALASTSLFAGDGWWDMENCEMCKPFTAHEGLMENMVWEIHNISNGIIMITTVEEKYEEPYKKAGVVMQKVINKLIAGEQVGLCNSCQSMNQMFIKGAKMENITTKTSDISIMTAETPELVSEIHTWADKSNVELAKMEKEHEAHKGHDHADH